MTPLDYIRFLIDQGAKLSNRQAEAIHAYFHQMQRRGRVVNIFEGEHPIAFATFFLMHSADQIPRYHLRPVWSTPADAPSGPVIYLDLVCATTWNRQLRRDLSHILTMHYPELRDAYWHRLRGNGLPDRLVHWKIQEVFHAIDL